METMKNDKEIKEFLRKMVKPIKNLPFEVFVEGTTEYNVISFDKEKSKNTGFMDRIKEACSSACDQAYQTGIFARRINEVGNYIEPFVVDALISAGMKAGKPKTKDGSIKATGYPDIYAEDSDGTPFYLECKTYNEQSIDTSFRSFYLSPSTNPKITKNAMHLVVGFEIIEEDRNGKRTFVPIKWKLLSLESLKGQIKFEFNASNKDLYSLETKIAEGSLVETNEGNKTLTDYI